MAEPVQAPPDAQAITYSRAADLPSVRAFAATHARACGLGPDRTDDLVLAISELATNTLQHTTGGGRILVWAEPGRLICDVVDDGGPVRPFGRAMPPAHAEAGRGLAIVGRLCDDVRCFTTASGTVTRLRLEL